MLFPFLLMLLLATVINLLLLCVYMCMCVRARVCVYSLSPWIVTATQSSMQANPLNIYVLFSQWSHHQEKKLNTFFLLTQRFFNLIVCFNFI